MEIKVIDESGLKPSQFVEIKNYALNEGRLEILYPNGSCEVYNVNAWYSFTLKGLNSEKDKV